MISSIRRFAVKPNTQIAVGLMWSFSALIVKDLTKVQGLDIFLISALRSLIGFGFILPLFFRDHSPAIKNSVSSTQKSTCTSKPLVLSIKIFGGCALAANSFLLCWAFEHTSALTPVFMHYSGLLMVAPASLVVLHYFPTRREWLATVLTVAGLTALVFHGLAFDKGVVVLVSVAVGLTQFAGQLSIAWLSKDDERVERESGVSQSNAGQCFLICEVLTIIFGIAFAQRTSFSRLDFHSFAEIALLGTITWGLPNLLALVAVRTKEMVSLSLLWLADPIFVAFWPVAFSQDAPPPPLAWLGGLLILSALVIQRTGHWSRPDAAV